MKSFKIVAFLTLSVVMLTSFSHCKSLKKTSNIKDNKNTLTLESKAPFTLGNTHFQTWVAGVKGGGSGIHMYINVKSNINNIVFDSAYFRGLQSKIKPIKMGYIASFKTEANNQEDIIMSNNKTKEYGNTMPNVQKFPFQLKDSECVISYLENNQKKYIKIENLIEKKRIEYPSAPSKR